MRIRRADVWLWCHSFDIVQALVYAGVAQSIVTVKPEWDIVSAGIVVVFNYTINLAALWKKVGQYKSMFTEETRTQCA